MAWPYYNNRRTWAHSLPAAPRHSPAVASEMERIDAVLSSPYFDSLASSKKDFIHSIRTWAATKGLSDGQLKYLMSVERDIVPVDISWWDASNPENIAKRAFVVAYYKANGYWVTVIPKMEADPTYMPDKDIWDRMWDNKFISARFTRFNEGNKHNVGDVVIGKREYGGSINGIVRSFTFSYSDGHWQYDILDFESGRSCLFNGNNVKSVEKKRKTKTTSK